MSELMQWRGVRHLSVCLSVRLSVLYHFAQIASSTRQMAAGFQQRRAGLSGKLGFLVLANYRVIISYRMPIGHNLLMSFVAFGFSKKTCNDNIV